LFWGSLLLLFPQVRVSWFVQWVSLHIYGSIFSCWKLWRDDEFGVWTMMFGAGGGLGMCSVYGFYGRVPVVLLLAELPEAYLIWSELLCICCLHC
jgi:hypothetical protein